MTHTELWVQPVNSTTGSPFTAADVVELFERTVPDYRTRRLTLRDSLRLARTVRAKVHFTSIDVTCPGFIVPPLAGYFHVMISSKIDRRVPRWIVLHELTHIVAHSLYGPRCLDEERLCDLVAGIGATTPAERALPRADLVALIRRLQVVPVDPDWPSRAEELAAALSMEAYHAEA